MEKILLIADIRDDSDAVLFLKTSYDVTIVRGITSVQFVKDIKNYDLIISEIMMESNGVFSKEETLNNTLTGIKFFEKELKKFFIPVLFLSINDSLRAKVRNLKLEDENLKVGFTQKHITINWKGEKIHERYLLLASEEMIKGNYSLYL